VLSEAFTQERVNRFLDRRAAAPIKSVLLMQETFPGVGNWMADEILWRARIHPATRSGRIGVAKRRRLYECIREVSEDALNVIGTDWNRPPDDWLFNHRWKDGGHCPRTGGLLKREQIGGRTTCWSPRWQRLRC
jgi:formamidopyrimidine-DNA glycosylase